MTAQGTDGFDYKSSTITFLAEEEPGVEQPGDGSGEENEESGDGEGASSEAGGMSGAVIAGVIFLVILMVIASVLGAMILRSGKEQQPAAVDWGTETSFAAPAAAPIAAAPAAYAAPTAPAPVPAVQSVPDYTHLRPGGQYVTGHAGETVYLSPDGTAWTMQADSSFIRTS